MTQKVVEILDTAQNMIVFLLNVFLEMFMVIVITEVKVTAQHLQN